MANLFKGTVDDNRWSRSGWRMTSWANPAPFRSAFSIRHQAVLVICPSLESWIKCRHGVHLLSSTLPLNILAIHENLHGDTLLVCLDCIGGELLAAILAKLSGLLDWIGAVLSLPIKPETPDLKILVCSLSVKCRHRVLCSSMTHAEILQQIAHPHSRRLGARNIVATSGG